VLTGEVLEAFEWFEWTHEVVSNGLGGLWWSLVRLPGEGSIGAQDARMMATLDVVRSIENGLLREKSTKGDPDVEREAWHEEVKARDRG
jgi:hypothetical protein